MKTAVIYNSQTGFTKRYAEWISEAVGADCFELRDTLKKSFESYGCIVFGGWACAGRISKIDRFKARMDGWSDKRLIVFCTGGSPAESPDIKTFLEGCFSEEEQKKVSLFYCPGGFCYEKMPATSKLMMRAFRSMLRSKKVKSESEREMLEMISHSYDISDRRYIEPIVQLIRKTDSEC